MFTTLDGDAEQDGTNKVLAACIEEVRASIAELEHTVARIVASVSHVEGQFADRMEDPRYRQLIRRAFTGWSREQGEEKREMIRRLLTHAAEMPDVDYDMFRLFFDWVSRYNELHFRVMKVMRGLHHPTRKRIWQGLGGQPIRDDSAKADVFKCLILDLSFGHVIRQVKVRTASGATILPTPKKRAPRSVPRLAVSATDDDKPYELTAVGRAFIHHVFTEIVPKLHP